MNIYLGKFGKAARIPGVLIYVADNVPHFMGQQEHKEAQSRPRQRQRPEEQGHGAGCWGLENGNRTWQTTEQTINVISYSITSSIKIKLNDMRRWDIKAMRCESMSCQAPRSDPFATPPRDPRLPFPRGK